MISEDVFVGAVRAVLGRHPCILKERRQQAERLRKEPDLIWELILNNFATWGNSRGVAVIDNSSLHDPIRFRALCALSSEGRRNAVQNSFKKATVSRAASKLPMLLANFDRIQNEGGPDAIVEQLNAKVGRDAKIRYLRTFHGIGPKFARNMMMDISHPEFEQSIAIDQRIKKISQALGLTFSGSTDRAYNEHEQFYLQLASRAGWSGWELDRILYTYFDEVLTALRLEERPARVKARLQA